MKIACIGGTGNLGFGLALRCALAGHEIYIGSRSLDKAAEAADRIRALAPQAAVAGGTNESAAAAGELLVLSLPFAAHADTLPALAPHAQGKVALDTTVPMVFGRPPIYDAPPEGSAAEAVAALLPGARVVSGFHTVSAASLAEPGRQLSCDALLCGDDAEAKQTVVAVAGDFIERIVDAGPLCMAQAIERLTPLLISLNQRYKRKHIGIRLSGME